MKKRTIYIIIGILAIVIVVSAVLRELTNRLAYQVISTNLSPEQPLSVVGPVEITLNKPVTQQFIDQCQTEFTPETPVRLAFNDTTLQIFPSPLFVPETEYIFSLNCPDLVFGGGFTTLSYDDTPLEDQGRLQTIFDYEVGTETEAAYTQNPWLAELPLVSETYEVVYSSTDNAFLVSLQLPPGDQTPRSQIQLEIRNRLNQIEAPEDIPIVFR